MPTPCFEALVARIKEMQSSHDADDSAVNVPGLEIRKVSATATSLHATNWWQSVGMDDRRRMSRSIAVFRSFASTSETPTGHTNTSMPWLRAVIA